MNQINDTNKRIAEKCGIKPEPYFRRTVWIYGGVMHESPPNYTESLDAIREAVLAQDGRFQDLFTSELDEMERINRTAVWKLTAADWCAAFLAVVDEGRGGESE